MNLKIIDLHALKLFNTRFVKNLVENRLLTTRGSKQIVTLIVGGR